MVYLVDTSVIIEYLRGNPKIRDFLTSNKNDFFTTSCICEAEVLEGVYRERNQKNFLLRKKEVEILFQSFYKVFPFDSSQAGLAGEIRADLRKKGEKIDDLDVLIAAASLKNDAVLWTKNPKHFEKVKNLQVLPL